jgi:hypothetical protein
MDRAARFRAKAEECRRHAQQMSLNDHRDALLEIARYWDELADSWQRRTEKKDGEPSGSAEGDSSS